MEVMLFLWDQERNIFETEQGMKALHSLVRFRYKRNGEEFTVVRKCYM